MDDLWCQRLLSSYANICTCNYLQVKMYLQTHLFLTSSNSWCGCSTRRGSRITYSYVCICECNLLALCRNSRHPDTVRLLCHPPASVPGTGLLPMRRNQRKQPRQLGAACALRLRGRPLHLHRHLRSHRGGVHCTGETWGAGGEAPRRPLLALCRLQLRNHRRCSGAAGPRQLSLGTGAPKLGFGSPRKVCESHNWRDTHCLVPVE